MEDAGKTQMSTHKPCSVHTYRANVNSWEKKNRMLDFLSLKLIAPNLFVAVGVLNVNPRNEIRENYSQFFTELLWSLTRMNLYLIYTLETLQCYFIFDYSVSVPDT